MQSFKIANSVIALLISACVSGYAQDPAAIQQKLVSEYALTTPTAANDDIVTAGAVIVLKKVRIDMSPVSSTSICQNTYKEGKMTHSGVCGADKASRWIKTIPVVGGSVPGTPGGDLGTRTFVPGEKMWVTGIDVKPDGIYFGLFTDAFSDVRYRTNVKFQFPKGFTLTTDQVDKMVAEVFSVAPADNTADNKQSQPAGGTGPQGPQTNGPSAPPQPASAAPQTQEAAPPPIAPPPPPPADPKTIGLKQTTDQVVANFGQPDKIIKLAAGKEIYVYKDMKVTFVGGKVTDIQ